MGLFSRLTGAAGSFVKDRVSNTTAAFKLIVADFKRYILILKYIFLSISALTVIYNIVVKAGNLVINCSLLGLLVVYSVVDAILKAKQKPNASKKVRLAYAWLKIFLNAAALTSSLYSLYSATANEVKPYAIVLATLSMIMFVLKVLIEICYDIFLSKWELLKGALALDAKEHPNTSGKLFSPLVGDVEEIEVKESIIDRIRKKRSD